MLEEFGDQFELSALQAAEGVEEFFTAMADRLMDEHEIRRSRQFPYQSFAADMNVSDEIPRPIKAALHKAAEIACGNVPKLPGRVVANPEGERSDILNVGGFSNAMFDVMSAFLKSNIGRFVSEVETVTLPASAPDQCMKGDGPATMSLPAEFAITTRPMPQFHGADFEVRLDEKRKAERFLMQNRSKFNCPTMIRT